MSFDSTQPHVSRVEGDPPTWWVIRSAEVLSGPYVRHSLAYEALDYHRAHPWHVGYPPVMGGQGRTGPEIEGEILGFRTVVGRLLLLAAALVGLTYLLS